MISPEINNYFIRDSQFSLVELSLLARLYEAHCLPSSTPTTSHPESLAQTLLKMKATEKNGGELRVAIHGEDLIGFYWNYDEKVLAHWVMPEHRNKGVESKLLGGH